jgi:hypothetical protein
MAELRESTIDAARQATGMTQASMSARSPANRVTNIGAGRALDVP